MVQRRGTDSYCRKHMDKHTRPYVCEEIGCEKIQGFTYSGGLHRHQREVHHQHGGPKASCLCPHHDCKRSLIGRGFTRKENLAEHLRRVHRGDVDEAAVPSHTIVPTIAGVFSSTSPHAQVSRKRKKLALDGVEADSNDNGDLGDETGEDLDPEVKRLRRELQRKDERVRQLESVIEKLQRLAKEQMQVTNAV